MPQTYIGLDVQIKRSIHLEVLADEDFFLSKKSVDFNGSVVYLTADHSSWEQVLFGCTKPQHLQLLYK